jgi:TRAP-type C4-dicarboxylate transport system permease small subunit
MYFGLVDFWVFLAYALCILCSLLCIVYGLINWNRNGGEITPEDISWAKDEDKMEENL